MNTQSETDFINEANDRRAQCRAEILATEASRDAHQVKMLTSDRPILDIQLSSTVSVLMCTTNTRERQT